MAGITLKMANVQIQMARMVKEARKFSRGRWCTVGFHANVKSVRQRKADDKSTTPVPSNPEVAAWNHFGTEKTPARPFLDIGIAKNKARVAKAAEEVLASGGSVAKAVESMGSVAVGCVQQYVSDNFIPPPNSPRTIERKHSSHPLIDTRELIRSVSYQVTKE